MKKRWNVKRSQWLGILVLIIIIAAVETVIYFAPRPVPAPPTSEQVDSLKQTKQQYSKFPRFQRKKTVYNPHTFDPNTADSITLTEVGFRDWQAHNILKYRAAGGKYKTKESLKRVYGMTDSLYNIIEPYVEIDSSLWINPSDTVKADTLRYHSNKRDTIIELNSADTTTLQYIRGIGSYRAMKIITYRDELGGYVSAEQIREINLKTKQGEIDSILIHLTACRDSIHPINVNRASVRRLTKHPYISYQQACDIYDLRRSRGRLRNLNSLQHVKSLTTTDIERLEPYLSFSEP
ncbi:MAG: helix-hairpin-helix domain-containing protein [Paludibacteraceae bacterium]|nr:helix-hairpin-helix domain-containing protein [Paludibacteraceae bacterium]